MKSKLTTINKKLEDVVAKKPQRLMGFKEWVAAFWKPWSLRQ